MPKNIYEFLKVKKDDLSEDDQTFLADLAKKLPGRFFMLSPQNQCKYLVEKRSQFFEVLSSNWPLCCKFLDSMIAGDPQAYDTIMSVDAFCRLYVFNNQLEKIPTAKKPSSLSKQQEIVKKVIKSGKIAEFTSDGKLDTQKFAVMQQRKIIKSLQEECKQYLDHLAAQDKTATIIKNDPIQATSEDPKIQKKFDGLMKLLAALKDAKDKTIGPAKALQQFDIMFNHDWKIADDSKTIMPPIKNILKQDRSNATKHFFKMVAYYLSFKQAKSLLPEGERVKHRIKQILAPHAVLFHDAPAESKLTPSSEKKNISRKH